MGLAINPAAKVNKDKINAVEGVVSPKKTVGKINAAEAPYKKKSYHSILVPAKEISATFCMFDFELMIWFMFKLVCQIFNKVKEVC